MTNKLTNVKALEMVLEIEGLSTELREKLTKMKETFEKKNLGKTETTRQKENVVLKEKILEVLSNGEKLTVTQIMKLIPLEVTSTLEGGEGLSNQRTTNLLGQLVKENKVVREVDGRKPYFFLAPSQK